MNKSKPLTIKQITGLIDQLVADEALSPEMADRLRSGIAYIWPRSSEVPPNATSDLLMDIAREVEGLAYTPDRLPDGPYDARAYDNGWRDCRADAALYVAGRAALHSRSPEKPSAPSSPDIKP